MRELRPLLDDRRRTVAGGTLADAMDAAEDVPGQTVIRSRANPVFPVGGMAVLRGNLAPAAP